MLLLWFALTCLAFFIGVLPLGMLLLRVAGLSDVESGSGNPGATNVARHHGLEWGQRYGCWIPLKGFWWSLWRRLDARAATGYGRCGGCGAYLFPLPALCRG